jgi:hypothetical protein
MVINRLGPSVMNWLVQQWLHHGDFAAVVIQPLWFAKKKGRRLVRGWLS